MELKLELGKRYKINFSYKIRRPKIYIYIGKQNKFYYFIEEKFYDPNLYSVDLYWERCKIFCITYDDINLLNINIIK